MLWTRRPQSPATDQGDMVILRLRRLFVLLAGSLALLFAVLGPESTRSLGFLAGYVFWLLHIGFGLGLAVLVAMGLARWLPGLHRQPLLDLALAGVLGSLLFAPLALGLEQLFVVPELPDADPDWMDRLESRGGAWALAAEWLQLAPPYLAAWLCINVAAVPGAVTGGSRGIERATSTVPASGGRAVARVRPTDRVLVPPQTGAVDAVAQPRAADENPGESPNAAPLFALDGAAFVSNTSRPDLESQAQPEPAASFVAGATADVAHRFLALLPPAIGDDIISIRADLHYLHVRTRRGQATVLGGLAAAEAALGARGLRVHRSYWVALTHVRRVSRGARGWSCHLSDGTRVPISRRRTADVRRLLGLDFVVEDGPDSDD